MNLMDKTVCKEAPHKSRELYEEPLIQPMQVNREASRVSYSGNP
ncbi:hypothetical protein GCM10008933_11450 [Paenibacillus motobuensis]|uniref:Uncharacterized protein n=1 Tax=Paenibacillus motobuensis TaxID=295324 RepID=A0ABN0Y4G8_9BACL